MNHYLRLAVVEGNLEVPAVCKLMESLEIAHADLQIVNKYGRDRFWRDISRYNDAARSVSPIFALADLEQMTCASGLCAHYVPHRHPDLLLRIAVRMLESWVSADCHNLAGFLGVAPALLPDQPDLESNPKLTLVNLARRSRRRKIRADLVPESESTGIVGKM